MSKFERSSRRLLAASLLFGLVLRAITPIGYMPGSLAEGTPFVLCPGSTPGASYFTSRSSNDHSHHAHQHDTTNGESTAAPWDVCPFGTAFVYAAPAAELRFDEPIFGLVIAAAQASQVIRNAPSRIFLARAPPATSS